MVLVAQWYTVRTLIFNSTSGGNDESRGISLVSLAFCRHLIKQQKLDQLILPCPAKLKDLAPPTAMLKTFWPQQSGICAKVSAQMEVAQLRM